MKAAVFFLLAFIAVAAAQWNPWDPNAPCDSADDCALPDVYCCIYQDWLGHKKCELMPMEGWQCWPDTDCGCQPGSGLSCVQDPASTTTGASCQRV